MFDWWAHGLARANVPNSDGVISGDGEDSKSIRAKLRGINFGRVCQRLRERLAGEGIPNSGGFVRRAGDQLFPVGTESGADHLAVLRQRFRQRAPSADVQ